MPFFYSDNKTRVLNIDQKDKVPNKSKILNINQAAEVLNCSVKTLYRRVQEKQIHSTRICHNGNTRGTPHLFLVRDLYAYIKFGVKQYSKLLTWQKKELEEYFG